MDPEAKEIFGPSPPNTGAVALKFNRHRHRVLWRSVTWTETRDGPPWLGWIVSRRGVGPASRADTCGRTYRKSLENDTTDGPKITMSSNLSDPSKKPIWFWLGRDPRWRAGLGQAGSSWLRVWARPGVPQPVGHHRLAAKAMRARGRRHRRRTRSGGRHGPGRWLISLRAGWVAIRVTISPSSVAIGYPILPVFASCRFVDRLDDG